MAGVGPVPVPTFNWSGHGSSQGRRTFYSSFTFCKVRYSLGDFVYLLPEDEGAPLYIARIISAYEDAGAAENERLCIEVQWYERPSNLPPGLQHTLHEHEVVESNLTDVNLVGCIDHKALVVRAASYEEAREQLPSHIRGGEWHFCRGTYDASSASFRPYDDMVGVRGSVAAGGRGGVPCGATTGGHQPTAAALALAVGRGAGGAAAAGPHSSPSLHYMDDDDDPLMQLHRAPPPAPLPPPARGPAPRAAARAAAAPVAAAAPRAAAAVAGVPGKVCFECGATQTPQWREGPLGPKTLCNACGVRYQRSQNKSRNNSKRERRLSPLGAAAGKGPRGGAATASSGAAAASGGAAAAAPAVASTNGGAGPATGGRRGGSRGGASEHWYADEWPGPPAGRQSENAMLGLRPGRGLGGESAPGEQLHRAGGPSGFFAGEGGSGNARTAADILAEEVDGRDGQPQRQRRRLDGGSGHAAAAGLQRMRTEEAADVLSTFRGGHYAGAVAGLPPVAAHAASASPGSEGRLLQEHLHGDLLQMELHLDDGLAQQVALAMGIGADGGGGGGGGGASPSLASRGPLAAGGVAPPQRQRSPSPAAALRPRSAAAAAAAATAGRRDEAANGTGSLVGGSGAGAAAAAAAHLKQTPSPLLAAVTAPLDTPFHLEGSSGISGVLGSPSFMLDGGSSAGGAQAAVAPLLPPQAAPGGAPARTDVLVLPPSASGNGWMAAGGRAAAPLSTCWHAPDLAGEEVSAPQRAGAGAAAATAAAAAAAASAAAASGTSAQRQQLAAQAQQRGPERGATAVAAAAASGPASAAPLALLPPVLAECSGALAALPHLMGLLPGERVAELVAMKEGLEVATNDAKAADAAVAAVTQVLQHKQQAAERAHRAAQVAIQQFQLFVGGLAQQYGLDVHTTTGAEGSPAAATAAAAPPAPTPLSASAATAAAAATPAATAPVSAADAAATAAHPASQPGAAPAAAPSPQAAGALDQPAGLAAVQPGASAGATTTQAPAAAATTTSAPQPRTNAAAHSPSAAPTPSLRTTSEPSAGPPPAAAVPASASEAPAPAAPDDAPQAAPGGAAPGVLAAAPAAATAGPGGSSSHPPAARDAAQAPDAGGADTAVPGAVPAAPGELAPAPAQDERWPHPGVGARPARGVHEGAPVAA